MANVGKNTYDENNWFGRVTLQVGKFVHASEWNEQMDIGRVRLGRTMDLASSRGVEKEGDLRITQHADPNTATMAAGKILVFGVEVEYDAANLIFASQPISGSRTDRVYVRLREIEVNDPDPHTETGMTSYRMQFAADILVTDVAQTETGYWTGGECYVQLATVVRTAGQPQILNAAITNTVHVLPAGTLSALIEYKDNAVNAINAGAARRLQTPGDDLTFDVDYDSAVAGSELVRIRFGRDHSTVTSHEIRSNSLVKFGAPTGTKEPLKIQDSVTPSAVPFSDAGFTGDDDAGAGLLPPNRGGLPYNSILRFLNGRPYIVCGDGVETFGDFNGVDAIERAFFTMSAATPTPVAQFTIFVKKGDYTTTTSLIVNSTGIQRVLVIGEAGASLTSVANLPVFVGLDPATELVVEGLSVQQNSSSDASLTFGINKVTFRKMVRLRGCFDGCDDFGLVEDVRFWSAASTANDLLTGDGTLRVSRVYELLLNSGGFSDGEGFIEKTTVVCQAGFTGFRRCSLRDCTVTAENFGGDMRFYRPAAVSKDPAISLENVSIKVTSDNTVNRHLDFDQSIHLRNVAIDVDGYVAAPGSSAGCAVMFRGTHTTLDNVTLTVRRTNFLSGSYNDIYDTGAVGTGRMAAIAFEPGSTLNIRGLVLKAGHQYDSKVLPRQFVYFYGDVTNRPAVSIDGIVFTQTGSSTQIMQKAFIRFVGTFNRARVNGMKITAAAPGAIPNTTAAVELGGSGTDADTAGGGIEISNASISGMAGHGILDTNASVLANTIRDCVISDITGAAASGVSILRKTSKAPAHVHRCTISGGTSVGIYCERPFSTIKDNLLYGNDAGSGTPVGINVVDSVSPGLTSISVHVTGNTVLNNNQTAAESICLTTPGVASASRNTFYGFDTNEDSGGVITALGTLESGKPMQFNHAKLLRST